MRNDLFSILQYPACRETCLSLAATRENNREILEGELKCGGCGRSFPLRNGAVDFVEGEDLPEAARIDREQAAQSDRNILEAKRKGEFLGELRLSEEEYRRDSFERTDFLFRDLEYDNPDERWVLDLGCGEPFLATRFAQLGFNVIGLDFTFPRLDLAHEYFERDGVYFERLLALMTRIPVRDRSIDVVFSHASLHRAVPHKAEEFQWYNPANMLDTLREVRRILKPDGLFLVSGEGEYAEDLPDEKRHLEQRAQHDGCYEAFYKMSEYEWAFREAGVFPHLWVRSLQNRLWVGTFLGDRYREIVTPDDAVNSRSNLLVRVPALKSDLNACLGAWARVRDWPGGARVPRSGGWLWAGDPVPFRSGWHDCEVEDDGSFRNMGRDPAVLAFELESPAGPWQIGLAMRGFTPGGKFDTAFFVERDGVVVARDISTQLPDPHPNDQERRFDVQLEGGPVTIRCIRDGTMRIRVYFNGDLLTTLDLPHDNQFHTYRIALPEDKVRTHNQITLEPSYALRPCDCGASPDERWLSCAVRDIRVEPADSE